MDSDTTHQYSAGVPDLGSPEYSATSSPPQDNDYGQQFWSPPRFSSPSASTEYWSTDPSPALSVPWLLHENIIVTWCEQVTWSAPSPLEGSYILQRPESESTSESDTINDPESVLDTPEEPVESLTQDEVDKNVKEMTCGLELEEHFWPIRYKIRSGKLRFYENTIKTLIIEARSDRTRIFHSSLLACEEPPLMHCQLSKLTRELASRRETSPSLTRFLDESRDLYERLWQTACELRTTGLQQFREAVWKDNLILILVLYEILNSKADLEEIMVLRGTKAQFMLDLMQDTIQTHIDLMDLRRGGVPRLRGARRTFLQNIIDSGLLQNVDRPSAQLDVRRLIVQLSEVSGLLPSSLAIRGIENVSPTPLAGGNFGDIFRGEYQGGLVALKRLRLFQTESEEGVRIRRKFCKEALIWKNLDHDYILPFIGVDSETFPGFLCMVSPWMDKGALVNNDGGLGDDSIPVLMHEIAVGLQYLHSENIVHGDLRGANILRDDQGHARLADFGLTVITDGPVALTNCGGSLRWMAPELLHPASCGYTAFQRTFASDIYSFGCVCLELYTGKPPFSENIPFDGAVLLHVVGGGRPNCPSTMPAWCQTLVEQCLSHPPLRRPRTCTIVESIVKSVRKRPRSPQEVQPLDEPASKRTRIINNTREDEASPSILDEISFSEAQEEYLTSLDAQPLMAGPGTLSWEAVH